VVEKLKTVIFSAFDRYMFATSKDKAKNYCMVFR